MSDIDSRDTQSRQLLHLATLIQIEKRTRAAAPEELGFVMVNETATLVPYRQALLWRQRRGKVVAVSGVSVPDPQAPFVIWAERLCAHLARTDTGAPLPEGIREFGPADLPEPIAREWRDWMAPCLVWIPLGPGALVLGREEPLREGERALLGYLADAYAHAWRATLARRTLPGERGGGRAPRRLLLLAGAMTVVALGFVPVRHSVLAPAEIVPRQPAVVRAPLDGVVDRIIVQPNETVAEGDLLFMLDPRRLRNDLEVATRALDAAAAELRQARQAAVIDPAVRASLPMLQGKLDQQQAEADYLAQQLARIEVRATRAGLAVFDDPGEWLGRPVAIGERVMLIADPARIEVEARLPAGDAIDLDIGAPVRLFLNIAPERSHDAVLTFVSYQPQKGADGVLGYRVKAALTPDAQMQDARIPPRIGLKGTAKLYGAQVPLAYFLFRRPVAAARQWLGF